MKDIQAYALLELTQTVKAELCGTMPVPASWSSSVELPAGLRIRLAWDFMPDDDTLNATPEDDRDRRMLEAVMKGTDDPGTVGFMIRIDRHALEGSFTAIENRIWHPQDMDLTRAGHRRFIARRLGLDHVWLDILPPSSRAGVEQTLDHLRSGSITYNEFINEVLGILDAHQDITR